MSICRSVRHKLVFCRNGCIIQHRSSSFCHTIATLDFVLSGNSGIPPKIGVLPSGTLSQSLNFKLQYPVALETPFFNLTLLIYGKPLNLTPIRKIGHALMAHWGFPMSDIRWRIGLDQLHCMASLSGSRIHMHFWVQSLQLSGIKVKTSRNAKTNVAKFSCHLNGRHLGFQNGCHFYHIFCKDICFKGLYALL